MLKIFQINTIQRKQIFTHIQKEKKKKTHTKVPIYTAKTFSVFKLSSNSTQIIIVIVILSWPMDDHIIKRLYRANRSHC